MSRKSIEVDYNLDMDFIKDAIDYYLSLDQVYNKDIDTLMFEKDDNGNVIGASLKVWL